MARYVLLPRLRRVLPKIRQRIVDHPSVEVIDETRGKALIVEGTDDAAAYLRDVLTGWIVNPEIEHP